MSSEGELPGVHGGRSAAVHLPEVHVHYFLPILRPTPGLSQDLWPATAVSKHHPAFKHDSTTATANSASKVFVYK